MRFDSKLRIDLGLRTESLLRETPDAYLFLMCLDTFLLFISLLLPSPLSLFSDHDED